jgi:ribosomal protein S8E
MRLGGVSANRNRQARRVHLDRSPLRSQRGLGETQVKKAGRGRDMTTSKLPVDAGTVIWELGDTACTRVIHPIDPIYEIRLFVNARPASVVFFSYSKSATQ